MLNWRAELRHILEVADEFIDPVERVEFLELARAEIAEVLTSAYEEACWYVRAADRTNDLVERTALSRRAVIDYSRAWNARLDRSQRIRWADPFHPHRVQRLPNLTDVAEGNSPDAVLARWRQAHPHPAQEG
jgi:hypothetical protein